MPTPIYTVRAGDTLSAIAARLGVSWQSIAAANGLSAPYTLHIGQVLQITSGGGFPGQLYITPAGTVATYGQQTQPAVYQQNLDAFSNWGGSSSSASGNRRTASGWDLSAPSDPSSPSGLPGNSTLLIIGGAALLLVLVVAMR